MANISTEIQAIESASRGEEVRDSIVSALRAINEENPTFTPQDSGKFVTIDSSGNMVATAITQAEGVSF